MPQNKPQPKPYIMDITPYAQGKSKTGSGEAPARLIKLSSNENPLGPSPQAITAFRTMGDLNRYPDGSATALRTAIAEVFALDAARIVCGAGSDELINLIIHAYAGPGDEVLYSQYGFLMYSIYAKAHGATPVAAQETDLTADVDALLAKVSKRTKLLFLANPNNPTGTYLPALEVMRLRDSLPPRVLLVLDAAYAEYVEAADYEAGKALVEATENTVMLRTFSKIYGLPSLRLGWGYMPEAVAGALNRIRSPFNVSSAAMEAAIAAVRDTHYTQYAVEYNRRERARLFAAVTEMGLAVTPSAGNFLLIHFPEGGKNAANANQALLREGIIPREMGAYGLPGSLRVTVGLDEENSLLIDALQRFMDERA